jgi:Domain of unknown function (DUF4326)
MTAPRRVQVTGDRFHPRVPDGAVYVGRAAPYLKRSRYCNPFTVKEFGREEAVRLYREYLLTTPGLLAAARAELAGRDLACRCSPDSPCHADVLIELLANDDRSPFTDAKRRAYLYGDCALLALVVGELTGWPVVQIVVTEDDDDPELLMRHALVQMPDGRLLDADGPHDVTRPGEPGEITHHHQVVMLAAYAVPFEFGEWEVTDQDAHLWRTPEVMADAAVLAEFAIEFRGTGKAPVWRGHPVMHQAKIVRNWSGGVGCRSFWRCADVGGMQVCALSYRVRKYPIRWRACRGRPWDCCSVEVCARRALRD